MRKLALVATGAIAAAVLMVAPAGAGGTKVKVNNYNYMPKKVHVPVGGKVVWKDVEGTHTVTGRKGSYDKVLNPGDKAKKTFRHEGKWRYFCRFHEDLGQVGKVIVG